MVESDVTALVPLSAGACAEAEGESLCRLEAVVVPACAAWEVRINLRWYVYVKWAPANSKDFDGFPV